MKYGYEKFILIPKEIIYQSSLSKRRVQIFSYLCCRRSIDDTVAFSINDLCQWTHIKPNRQPGKINEKYMLLLAEIGKMGYFTCSPDFKTIKNIFEYHQITLDEKKFEHGVFGLIYLEDIEAIQNFNEVCATIVDTSGVSSYELLLLLSYLRVNIKYGGDDPQCCYRLYKTIATDTGLNERNIKKMVTILDTLKIIKVKERPIQKFIGDSGIVKYITPSKIFADYKRYDFDGNEILEYDCEKELEKQVRLLTQKEK